MRSRYSDKIEERLDHIKHGTPVQGNPNKKKISRFILIADIFLIIIIFFYFHNRNDETALHSNSVRVSDITYRLTGTVDKDRILFTTSLQASEKSHELFFDRSIAKIFVSYDGVTVSQLVVGKGKEKVTLEKESAQNFFTKVDIKELAKKLEVDSRSRPSLFSFLDKGEPIKAKVLFNNQENISLEITLLVKDL